MRLVQSYKSSVSLFLLIIFILTAYPPAQGGYLGAGTAQAQPIEADPAQVTGAHGSRKVNKAVHQRINQNALEPTVQPVKWIDVEGGFSLPVVQQPADDLIYVSNKRDLLTQFQLADQNGVVGLLAHDYLAGKKFYDLQVGQIVSITYQDDSVRHYQIISLHRYQKINPSDLYSDFVDLDTHEQLSSAQVFSLYYLGNHHLTLQTCLEGEGRLDWGLFFVTASPVDQ